MDTLDRILDSARNHLTKIERLGVSFTDIRYVEVERTILDYGGGKDNPPELRKAATGMDSGFGVRVLVDGAWGFASCMKVSDLERNYKKAIRMAKEVAERREEKVELAPMEPWKDRVPASPKVPFDSVDIKDKTELLKGMAGTALGHSDISSMSISYDERTSRTGYVSSEGADVAHEQVRCVTQAEFVARGVVGDPISYRGRMGGTMGFELFQDNDMNSIVEGWATTAVKLLSAKRCPSGRFPVIADPDLVGVMIHEALGHACEGDLVASGQSILKGRIGERIATGNVTVIDDPTAPGVFGSFPYDDEGAKAERKVLVDGGILKDFLLDRENAARLGMRPNGSSRAEGFNVAPLVRMSNTRIEGGEYGLEEIFSEVRNGIYAKGTRGGQVDTVKGGFQFNSQEAYLVENGEISSPLKDVSLAGDILTSLTNIDAMTRNAEWGSPGYCGKGQMVPVGNGGPFVRIQDMVMGGGL